MTDWPHAPVHRLTEKGAYMVTCGIYGKVHLLNDPERLTLVHDTLLAVAAEFGWQLQAWAILINHYHCVGLSPEDPTTLSDMLGELHERTAGRLNFLDRTPGRKVWFQYWDSRITYERSYLARLRYVHENPVRHGVAYNAADYPWCSAAWFARTASRSFQKTLAGFKIDRVNVYDEF